MSRNIIRYAVGEDLANGWIYNYKDLKDIQRKVEEKSYDIDLNTLEAVLEIIHTGERFED